MRTPALLGLLLLVTPVAGQPVAPPPREVDFVRRPPAKPGEFAGKTLAQWEVEARSGDPYRWLLAASAAHAWGPDAAPLARALVDTVPKGIDPHAWPDGVSWAEHLFRHPDRLKDNALLRAGPAAVPPLEYVVRRFEPTRVADRERALELCRHIGPASAPVLLELLRQQNVAFRREKFPPPQPSVVEAWGMRHQPAAGGAGYFARLVGHHAAVERRLRDPHRRVGGYMPPWPAADVLISLGPPAQAAAPELRRWLRGSDPALRCQAVYALPAVGDAADRAAVRAVMADASEVNGLRYAAFCGLVWAGDREGRATARAVLRSHPPLPGARAVAIAALGEARDPAVVPFAVAALDPAPKELTWECKAALRALERIGPAAGKPAAAVLRPLAARGGRHAPLFWVEAATALLAVDPTDPGPYRVWVESIDMEWADLAALDRLVGENRAAAVKVLDDLRDPEVTEWRLLAARPRLGAMGQRHLDRLDQIAVPFGSDRPNQDLFRALRWAGDPAVPTLTFLLRHRDRGVREAAARELAALGRADEPAVQALPRGAGDVFPEPTFRNWAVFAMRNADPQVAVPALRTALKVNPHVRFYTAVILADLDPGNPDVVKALLDNPIPTPSVPYQFWGDDPRFVRPTTTGVRPRPLGVVWAEALYKADPEAAVRAGVPSPFVMWKDR